jgi:hypothetical protein
MYMLLLIEYCYTVNMVVFVVLLIILPTTCLLASMSMQVKYNYQLHSAVELRHTAC